MSSKSLAVLPNQANLVHRKRKRQALTEDMHSIEEEHVLNEPWRILTQRVKANGGNMTD